MLALSTAAVLLIGWSITACTVDHGLDQLPPEFSGIGQEAYREACNKNYWAPLEQLVIVKLKAISVTGSALTGSMKVRVYSFFRIPWADVEVTWSGGHIRGMKTNRIFVSSAGEQATDISPDAPPDLTNTSNGGPVKMVFAADSCRVYMVDGVCFEYGCKDNAEFFGLFGVTLQ